jgi:hypothetical protein
MDSELQINQQERLGAIEFNQSIDNSNHRMIKSIISELDLEQREKSDSSEIRQGSESASE